MLPTLLLLCDKSVRSKKVQIKSVLVRISKLFNFMAKNDLETLKSHTLKTLKDYQFLRWMGFILKKSSEIILHQIQPLQSCMRKCVIRRLFLRTTSEAICPCVIRAAAVGEGLFPYFIYANKWVDSNVQCFQIYSFDWQIWNLSLFWKWPFCVMFPTTLLHFNSKNCWSQNSSSWWHSIFAPCCIWPMICRVTGCAVTFWFFLCT